MFLIKLCIGTLTTTSSNGIINYKVGKSVWFESGGYFIIDIIFFTDENV